MTAIERKLTQQVESLQRQVRELQQRAGLNDEALDAMKLDEAIEYMNRTGKSGLIKEYLKDRRREEQCMRN